MSMRNMRKEKAGNRNTAQNQPPTHIGNIGIIV